MAPGRAGRAKGADQGGFLLAAAILTGFVFGASPALACAPLIATDPTTGATYTSGSAEWLRREQAAWRARAAVVLIAQARSGRMVTRDRIEFTLVPIITVYGEPLPEHTLSYTWTVGNTCNVFTLGVGDNVIVYVDADGGIVGVTVPEQLQDRPPGLSGRLREIARGMIGPDFGHENPRTDRPDPAVDH